MVAKSGAYTLYGVPADHRLVAFQSGDNLAYKLYDSDKRVLVSRTEHDMFGTAPKIIPDPTVGKLFIFFANSDRRLSALRITLNVSGTGHNRKYQTSEQLLDLYDDDENPCRTHVASVHQIKGGVIVTYLPPDDSDLMFAYFSFEDLLQPPDGRDNSRVFPVTGTQHALQINASQDDIVLRRQSAAIVPNHTNNQLRLVVVFKNWRTKKDFKTYEFTLDTNNFQPTPAAGPTVVSAGDLEIRTEYPYVHTGLDGRAYISFYAGSSGQLVSLQRNLSTNNGQVTIVWDQYQDTELQVNSKSLQGLQVETEPTISYFPETRDKPEITNRDQTFPDSEIPVHRAVTIVYDDGDKYLNVADHEFGMLCRQFLPKVTTDVPPELVGVIEGSPPMSNEAIQSNESELKQSNMFSEIKLMLEDSTTGKSTLTNTFSSMIRVGLSIAASAGVPGDKVTEKTGVSLATTYLYESSHAEIKEYSDISAFISRVRTLKDDGRYVQSPLGTAYVLTSSIVGFAYYMRPPGVKGLEDLPPAIPVLYEYGAADMHIIPQNYYIHPADAIPGDIASYADLNRKSKLDQLPTLPFRDAQPQISWTAEGDVQFTSTARFAHEKQDSTSHSINVTAALTRSWEAQLGTPIAGVGVQIDADLKVEFSYTYATQEVNGTREELTFGLNMEQFAGTGFKALERYTSLVYIIQPDTGDAQHLTDSWIKRLIAADNPKKDESLNQKLYNALWDRNAGKSKVSGSNPWFIRYAVINVEPESFLSKHPSDRG